MMTFSVGPIYGHQKNLIFVKFAFEIVLGRLRENQLGCYVTCIE